LQLGRREMIVGAGAAGLLGSAAAGAQAGGAPSAHAHDWDWLIGNWDVWHRRLKDRLAGSTQWEEFPGESALWLALDGLATIDDNIVEIPSGTYRGLTVRAFDPASGTWAIWWVDGRNPTSIEAPVRGGFAGGSGVFQGPDTLRGMPILARFRWLDIYGRRPHWEQAFSPDGGATWEVNWENFFTRTAAAPTQLPLQAGYPRDFDFLHGRWLVRHRRLRHRLAASSEWESFHGTLVNWPVLGGAGNIGDNLFGRDTGPHRGIGMRTFDATRGEWLSWWLDGRAPSGFAPPLRGRFAQGVGTFDGDDVLDGRPVKTQVRWSRITRDSARWEQAMSADGGMTWETNWVSDFVRRG